MELEFLKLLESVRTPFWDAFFSLVTRLGEEMLFMVLGFIFFWCISKKKGYYILFVGFTGILTSQFLKILCRIPRPWVRDESLTVVGDAKIAAAGYSFPSGHTQVSVGGYGCVARSSKTVWFKVLCWVLCIFVAFSRMYLGVHTPLDVGVAFLWALVLVFAFYPLTNLALKCAKNMRIYMGVFSALAIAYLAFLYLHPFPADTDAANLSSALENAWKIFGAILGAWLSYEADNRFIKFDTKAVWWAQILKLILGLALVLAVKEFTKTPLQLLLGESVGDCLRYLLLVFFACGIWPMTFRFWGNLGRKSK